MAVDIATPASQNTTESIFESDWQSFGGDSPNDYENLEDIDLDNIFGPPPKAADQPATIDPQVLSNTAGPKEEGVPSQAPALAQAPEAVLKENDEDNIFVGPTPKVEKVEQDLVPAQPFLRQSIETPPDPAFDNFFQAQFNSQLHRRSVSEPPVGCPYDNTQPIAMPSIPSIPDPPMTFTRSGVHLGTPKINHGNRNTRSKHPHVQKPYSLLRPRPQDRYPLRRTQTQPLRHAPTSAPRDVHMAHYTPPPAMMLQQPVYGHAHGAPPAVSSRVCTPAPSPPVLHASPGKIDPNMFESSVAEAKNKGMITSLTVEELRGMITAAVQDALRGAVGKDTT